jgi:hypothetical protein
MFASPQRLADSVRLVTPFRHARPGGWNDWRIHAAWRHQSAGRSPQRSNWRIRAGAAAVRGAARRHAGAIRGAGMPTRGATAPTPFRQMFASPQRLADSRRLVTPFRHARPGGCNDWRIRAAW